MPLDHRASRILFFFLPFVALPAARLAYPLIAGCSGSHTSLLDAPLTNVHLHCFGALKSAPAAFLAAKTTEPNGHFVLFDCRPSNSCLHPGRHFS
eukprot:m.131334 g.131334  ORF g.131334 m.131334 type:complete len:95 (-) comp9810_c0_seq2:185-469(-)